MGKRIKIIFLGFIIILALGLRIYHLTTVPAGFFCDEAALGYNAYSLLKTGADEYGQPFPFFFRSFGDYRNPLPIYFMIPSISIFGLNEFAVRLTAATAGTLTILFVFLLTKELFNLRTALFSSFLLAISPWHIHFSRFGSEYVFFPFLFTLGFYLFVLGLRKKHFLPLGFFILGATLYTYYPAWMVVPLFLIGLILIYRHRLLKLKNEFLFGIIIFSLTLMPLLLGIKSGVALTRWNQVSVFKNNRLFPSVLKFASTYLNHFSLDFLFKRGDIDYPGHFITRFSVRGMGELFWFQLPLVLIGAFLLLKYWREKEKALLLWLALYPLGSSLIGTDGGGPFAFRSIAGVVPFQILSGLALSHLFSSLEKFKSLSLKLGKPLFLLLFLSIAFFSLKSYLYRYHLEYPLYSSNFWGWQYGPREIINYFKKVEDQYDELIMSGQFNAPQIFFKFYTPKGCQKCKIGEANMYNPNKKQLFALTPKELKGKYQYKTTHTIYYPNGKIAFKIVEIKNGQ